MKPRIRQAPRLLFGLTGAFAPDDRALPAGIAIARGMAIQIAYRWPLGEIECDRNADASLLWSASSERSSARSPWWRQVAAVCLAVGVGVALFLFSNVLLLVPVSLGLRWLGADLALRADVRLALISLRLAVTLNRALAAYRHDRRLEAQLPRASGRRIRIDYLAAFPPGRGNGRRLLAGFLARADERGIEVVLHCDRRNLDFYLRQGFRQLTDEVVDGQLALLRPARVNAADVSGLRWRGVAHLAERPLCVSALTRHPLPGMIPEQVTPQRLMLKS